MKSPWLVSVVIALAMGVLVLASGGARVLSDAYHSAGLSLPGSAPRADETDRIAETVATAVGYPRQSSADGFARAAQATAAARDGRLAVVESTALTARDALDPLARLVFRIHLAGTGDGFGEQPEVTYCYRAEFNRYGVVDEPVRVDCPPGATSVTPPPAPAQRRVPAGADRVVARALEAGHVEARVTTGVRRLTAAADLPPSVSVNAEGTAVAVSAPGTCLLGRRTGGKVEVWYVPPAMAQPGELSCDPGTALAGLGQRAPH
ncbi:MAG: hypothetical protein J7518_02085 [Nocardioidaceae bacterium]|nr:hypothetical protein [Nocardioidaceae bacterium]